MDAYNAVAEPILTRHNIALLDLPGFMRNLGPLSDLLKDHVHYKDEIVRQQAAFIAGYLINLAQH